MRQPVDRQHIPTKTFVLCPRLKGKDTPDIRSLEAQLEEAKGLALAINLDVLGTQEIRLSQYSSATLIGSGLVEELHGLFSSMNVTLVVVDHPLSPVQQRNLERAWKTKVIDRTGLILEIFGERAHTKEGVLQVELAALQYQRSRLVRSWTHLERQRGGFGFIGGPGESQIELDRRMIDDRIIKIKKDLEKTVRTRRLQRSARTRVPYPIIALVGYTNAGKSTLFNTLTKADVFVKDLLFATLDPTARQLKLPSGMIVILSDTVGFISNLPTDLIASFRATLEEVVNADIILHVRDISHPDTDIQKSDVDEVLNALGLEEAYDQGKVIEVWNKMDLVHPEVAAVLKNKSEFSQNVLPISAITGEGIPELREKIDLKLKENLEEVDITIPVSRGDVLAWCYHMGSIIKRKDEEEYIHLILRLHPSTLSRLWAMLG